jgi:nucleoside-diphosphate-sugar epimerase
VRILITGATGFVGGHLLARLGARHSVSALVRRGAPQAAAARVIEQDLGAPFDLARFPAQVDAVIHAAGLVGDGAGDRGLYERVNVEGTRQLVAYAERAGAARFVYLSSGAVYAPSAERLREDSPIAPRGDYAQSKWAGEEVVRAARSRFAIQILRLFFPYGPTQRGRLVPRLIERVAQGAPVRLGNADGDPHMNPIYVEDLGEQIERLLARPDTRDVCLNLAGPETASIRELAEIIGDALGVAPSFEAGHEPTGARLDAHIDDACALSSYRPQVGLAAGIRRTLDAEADRTELSSGN